MRRSIFLLFATLMGCSLHTRLPVFNIRSANVVTAFAEPLDKIHSPGVRFDPDSNAQIHIVFAKDGARRYEQFLEKHAGQNFELQVNGEVLLRGLGAYRFGVREATFVTSSMKRA